ncbi:MAG: response regulator [Acidobacteriota bacterium]
MILNKLDAAFPLRIMIVEDEALIAEELQERMIRLGFKVVGAVDSAEEAIKIANQARPDLVLMDIRLKGKMDGIEAADYIYHHLDIPVVYITAHSDQATLQRAKPTAPFGYVLKPFQEKDLLIAIELATHRHLLERRLRESEQKYAATLASIGDAVIATNSDGCITFMNPVAEALTTWKFNEASGLNIEKVFPIIDEASRNAIDNPVNQVLHNRTVITLAEPVLLVGRDGSLIPIDDTAAPIIDDKGRLLGAVVAFRDIRERRLAEDSLRRAEEQLRQSQKMEAIGRLAGGVAHDFNNLLTIITGYSDLLLLTKPLDNSSKNLVKEIKQTVARAAALTQQLLAFSRKQVLQPKVLDLNLLVTDMQKMLCRLIGEDIILTTSLSPTLAMVKVDPGQMEQVILNLAVNARDAMPQGGKLAIETSQVELDETIVEIMPEIKPGRYILLAVSDSGCGMDEATKAQLFEPFFTTKELGKGTGLGLATVYGTIKQFGGYIYIYSNPGQGATFNIYLPAVEEAVAVGKVFEKNEEVKSGNETVLLVEDEEGVRSTTSLALQTCGYIVLEASQGEEAISICQQHPGPIHLLITDIVMPRMSGPQIAAHLIALRPQMRVLYVSGYAGSALSRHGIFEGVAFLQKPYSLDTLANKIREVLDH